MSDQSTISSCQGKSHVLKLQAIQTILIAQTMLKLNHFTLLQNYILCMVWHAKFKRGRQSLIHVCYLGEFPGDADGPAEAVASDEQSLHGPACKMAKGKDVEVAQDPLPCNYRTVHSIFLEERKATEL